MKLDGRCWSTSRVIPPGPMKQHRLRKRQTKLKPETYPQRTHLTAPPRKCAFFTIVSNNYLHFARTLLRSVRQQEHDADLFCVLVDDDYSMIESVACDFNAITLDELNLPEGICFLFQYTILELNTAVKPWAAEHLMDLGYEEVIYLDPDIFVYEPLKEAHSKLRSGANIVITPHLLSPIADDRSPNELDIRKAGTYNLGFCAMRRTMETYSFLHWWQKKLTRHCVIDLDKGMFVDQSWIDLVPGLFDGVIILRNVGYNVAYWNLAQRPFTRLNNGRYMLNNEPLTFFHFSGFDPLQPEQFSKYQNRYKLSTLGPISDIVKDYASALNANGAETFVHLKYGFGFYRDGSPIPDIFRREYRRDEELRRGSGSDPFNSPRMLIAIIGGAAQGALPLTYSLSSLWNSSVDLQRVFNLGNQSCVERFYVYFLENADQYFPRWVLRAHLDILNGFLESKGLTPYEYIENPTVGLRRLSAIYDRLLNRSPDASGVETFVFVCEEKWGMRRVWREVMKSDEWKNKGLLKPAKRNRNRRVPAVSEPKQRLVLNAAK